MKTNFAMPYTESGITLHFPDNNYFCFENCTLYQKYSGNHFKEMDACWIDVANKTFYLIELKDHTNANLNQTETLNRIVWNLVKKTIDSYTMLLAVLLATPKSSDLQSCIPLHFDNTFQFKFVHIIKANAHQREQVMFIKDAFTPQIRPYRELLAFSYCGVITYEQAQKHFDWVR